MADRYQNRLYPTDHDNDRGANDFGRAESDPLAELARLIGQTDPFAAVPKPQAPAPHPLQSRANIRPQAYQAPVEEQEEVDQPAGPPPWMQRARHDTSPHQEFNELDFQPSAVHPLHRFAAQQAPAQAPVEEVEYQHQHDVRYADAGHEQPDPSRYDDALYGQIESGEQEFQRDPAYPDDPYAYQSQYEEEEPQPRKRSSGLMTVAAVLTLAVVGTGAAFAYRTYIGSPRIGEPPIIKADNSPTKVVPTPSSDAAAKATDRIVPGDGAEKIVSREETPVDVSAKSGPRVVFPPLNPNTNPPAIASVTPSAPPLQTTASNGTLPNNEPRKVRTLSVKGDNNDTGVPAAAPKPAAAASKPAPPAPHSNPSSANASANGPLSLTPGQQPDPAPTRVASTTPTPAANAGGGYVVQVSSQKTEADAQSSYRALQNKFPSVLGSRSPLIKRADLGDKGVYYRAMVGPFSSSDEASQFCGSLKSAGGQCVVQRN
jgi:hypothetical protein